MKRKRENYHICFKCTDEFIIIPLKRIEYLLEDKGLTERIYIPMEEIFPDGYVEYLEKVLNMNRHLPQFSYQYTGETPIRETGILKIMQRQLACMMVNDQYCFGEVKLVPCSQRVTGVELSDIIKIQR